MRDSWACFQGRSPDLAQGPGPGSPQPRRCHAAREGPPLPPQSGSGANVRDAGVMAPQTEPGQPWSPANVLTRGVRLNLPNTQLRESELQLVESRKV